VGDKFLIDACIANCDHAMLRDSEIVIVGNL